MNEDHYIKYESINSFIFNVLKKAGAQDFCAKEVAEGLSATSLKGIDSHGVKLIHHYVKALKSGRINKKPNFSFEAKSASAFVMDGDHAYGHSSGAYAMNKAIKVAKDYGICAIAVKNSSHFGAAGYFSLKAANQGCIGLSFTHADSLMKVFNGKKPYFGTNPISFCAPMKGEEPLYLDMATTNVSWNKVMNFKNFGRELAPGWVVDKDGIDTTDAKAAVCLNPFGGYKGFGLGMMVEILCSLLTGMPFGNNISNMYKDDIKEKRFLGQFYIAINIESFSDPEDFKVKLTQMANEVRSFEGVNDEVMVPGDPQKIETKKRLKAGIPIPSFVYKELLDLSNEFNEPLVVE
jgi:LDH2 family malate/lactate/ureidoglycolate dehydrogenase